MAEESSAEDSPDSIVIDNGSYLIKAGFSGDDVPRAVFRNIIAEKMVDDGSKYGSRKLVYGDAALTKQNQDGITLKHPIEQGQVRNWNDMEKIWHHTFYNELGIEPEEYRVLLSEVALNPKANREKACQIMMETFNVPAYYVCGAAVLALFASGTTTGLVVDCGFHHTQCVPVYDGSSLPHAITEYGIGGFAITRYLQELLLKKDGGKYKEFMNDLETVRNIKEKYGYIAEIGLKDEMNKRVCTRPKWLTNAYLRSIDMDYSKYTSIDIEKCCDDFIGDNDRFLRKRIEYKLPDGNSIELQEEMIQCTELLFDPLSIGNTGYNGVCDGLPVIVANCSSHIDGLSVIIRKELWMNVIVCGGGSFIKGFKERFESGILMTGTGFSNKDILKVIAPNVRKYSAWIGGSILSSLSTFEEMWLTIDEYASAGPGIVHRMFF